jgi:dihydrofolate synthase / folylpolyglutamate synthase
LDYSQTIEYLFSKLPMFHRIGAAAYKNDLTNILKLCEALNHPEKKFPAIHIAGTNGKGSTSSMLASVLQAAGLRTGLFTSPHLKSFTERIRVNGEQVNEAFVIDFVERTINLVEEIQPSFFELTTAMAFDYFYQSKVDVAVIETGMGGRLDSTNIVESALSIITNISWDHQQFLGDTLMKIAGEKAGIIKSEVPVVIGERQPESDRVFIEKAAECHAPVSFASDLWKVEVKARDLAGQTFDVYHHGKLRYADVKIDLPGFYQEKNLVTVMEAIAVLRKSGVNISEEIFRTGLASVRSQTGLSGRMTQLQTEPLILCDVGHNEAGVKEVLQQLRGVPHQQLHLVWGAVNDKDSGKILSLLPSAAIYYWVKPDLPRGLDANELKAQAESLGLKGQVYASVKEGLSAAKKAAGKSDLIFVGGSTFVVAEII